MNILFAGSPEIAVPSLAALVNASVTGQSPAFEVAALLTNPDTPKGRGGSSEPTALSLAASALSGELQARGLPSIVQFKPASLKEDGFIAEFGAALRGLGIDLLVSFAYGRIFSESFLALFPRGGINVHPSLLPCHRGAAPLQQAILEGDTETGVTIQRLGAKLDAGAILAQERFPLDGTETTASLSVLAAQKAAALLVPAVTALALGNAEERAQDEERATFCAKFNKDDGLIDWRMSARAIDARIRAFTPWPLSRTAHKGQELLILAGAPLAGTAQAGIMEDAPAGTVLRADRKNGIVVQTGDGLFSVTRLQYKAKKALDWRDFLNGARLLAGEKLGS